MGLLRNSLFIDVDKTGRTKTVSASPLSVTHHTDLKRPGPPPGPRDPPPRQRNQSAPVRPVHPLHSPHGPETIAPLPKRKSLSSILRGWRREETPPPMPGQTLTPARSHQTMRGPAFGPPSPTSSVFSTQTAPVQRFPGPGICSTLPTMSPPGAGSNGPSGPPGPPGPGPRYVPISPGGHRVYRGGPGGPHPQRVGSTPALGEHRAPMSISAPIPGVGDVPAHYRFKGDNAAPMPDLPISHALNGRPAQRSLPGLRQSVQGTPVRRPSMHGPPGGPNGMRPAYGPAPPRPAPPVGLGLSQLRQPSGDMGGMRPRPQNENAGATPQRPKQQHHRASSATIRAPRSDKRASEFIHDSEVAALLTDAHIPPTSPVASIPSNPSSTLLEEQRSRAPSVSSITSTHPPSAFVKASGASTAGSTPPIPTSTTDGSLRARRLTTSSQHSISSATGGPSSILSNVSWASIGSAKGKGIATSTTPRASTFATAGEKVEALADPPVSRTPKPMLPPLSAVPSPLSVASPLDTLAGQISTPVCGFEPLSSPSSSNSSPIDPIPKTRPLSVRPKSFYSTSAFRSDSPESLYSSLNHGRQESITSSIFGSHTPTVDHALSRSPSITNHSMQHVRDRNTALELTNARLETELTRVKSEANLRPRASFMSISAVSIGAEGEGTLGSGGIDSRASHRSSQLTVRDEHRDSRAFRRDSRRDSRSSAVSRLTSASNYDLSVPTLLAEIDALRRNGERLQAELFAVKSQVSYLFPPTPTELAEVETLEALSELESKVSGSSSGTPTRTRDRMSMVPHSKRASSASSLPFKPRSSSKPRVDTADGVDSDESTTPSSSASETWPITPVMNSEWSPPHSSGLNSSASSTHKIYLSPTGAAAANGFDYNLPSAPPMPISRIPRASSGRPTSASRPVSSIRVTSGTRPVSGRMTSTPPPRPPRAARRGEMPDLPPGAAAAVRSHANSVVNA